MRRSKVLLVDDDLDFLEATKTVFEKSDYDVVVATNGEECLNRAKEEKPDLIVLDIMLPDLDGYAICHQLKEDPQSSRIPILILTAISAKPKGYAAEIAAYHRADDYAEKPIGAQGLLEKARILLSGERVGRPPLAPKEKPAEEKREGKTPRILLADDDPDFVDAVKSVLEAREYEVTVAESGDECLEKAKDELPDLILLDVIFPTGKDGYTVCRELKENAKTRSIPIVMLTAVGKEFTRPDYAPEIAISHLVDDYADKPIEPQKLLRKIEKHLQP